MWFGKIGIIRQCIKHASLRDPILDSGASSEVNTALLILFVAGVKNITALGNVIQWQKVEYDFNFHKVDFPTNIICLVLSEGKSLMKVSLWFIP